MRPAGQAQGAEAGPESNRTQRLAGGWHARAGQGRQLCRMGPPGQHAFSCGCLWVSAPACPLWPPMHCRLAAHSCLLQLPVCVSTPDFVLAGLLACSARRAAGSATRVSCKRCRPPSTCCHAHQASRPLYSQIYLQARMPPAPSRQGCCMCNVCSHAAPFCFRQQLAPPPSGSRRLPLHASCDSRHRFCSDRASVAAS